MNEYAHAAKQIQMFLIEDYVHRNPGVQRKDVILKTANGKLVFSTIAQFFKEVAKTAPKDQDRLTDEDLKPLQQDDKSRATACAKSLETSKRLIDFLFMSKIADFGVFERNQHSQFLKRQKSVFLEKIKDSETSKKNILTMINVNGDLKRNLLKTYLTEFLHALVDQLKSQSAIYKREHELGNILVDHTQEIITNNFKNVKKSVSPKAQKNIAKIYNYLKKDVKLDIPTTQKLNLELIDDAIKKMEAKLETRRSQMDNIEKVVSFIETMVAKLEGRESKPQPTKPVEKKPPQKSTRRMAFISKLIDRVTR